MDTCAFPVVLPFQDSEGEPPFLGMLRPPPCAFLFLQVSYAIQILELECTVPSFLMEDEWNNMLSTLETRKMSLGLGRRRCLPSEGSAG